MSERGRPFEPGNRFGKGRPKESEKSQKSLRLQELLLARGEEITAALIARAKKGDRSAMSLAMDRLIPRLKEVGVLPVEDRAKLPIHIRLQFVNSPYDEAEHGNTSTPTTAEHTTIEDDDDPESSESADEQHDASGEAANAPDGNHDSTENDPIAHIVEQLRQTEPHLDHITALCEYEQRARRRPVRTFSPWS